MEMDILNKLSASVAAHKCVLFAGSGLTAGSGGCTWSGLTEYLKKSFRYSSPLTDNFEIMADIARIHGHENLYEAVRKRLSSAEISEKISNLIALPWYTTFTTNYDLALEKSLKEKQTLTVRTVVSGREFALSGLSDEILCVKLMGSLHIPYGQKGSMVLTPNDLTVAREERPQIFNTLASHAANLSFLFIGYSFDDKLFLEILAKLNTEIGTPKHSYYALFREEPSEEKRYLLETNNVEIIVKDLECFAECFSEKVKLLNPKDFSLTRLSIGLDVVPIDIRKTGKFLSLYSPVLFDDLERDINPYDFLRGNVSSFKPFSLKWNFQRPESKTVFDILLKETKKSDRSKIVSIKGNPGSGRTFIILSVVLDLIIKSRAIAIKIGSNSYNQIPDARQLYDFCVEVEKACQIAGVEIPERVVFWAEFLPDLNVIAKFEELSSNFNRYPMHFIYEEPKDFGFREEPFTGDVISVDIDTKMSENQKEELKNYLLNTTRKHKFQERTAYDFSKILSGEETFLAIMYRALDPTQRSIQRIIQEEFNNIIESEVRQCVVFCSLSSSMSVNMPVAVLRKALGIKIIGRHYDYPEIFEIEKKARAFIIEFEDIRTNPYVSVYHSLIARYLVDMISKDMDECLKTIAENVDITVPVEAEFVRNLLIEKGLKGDYSNFHSFSDDGLEAAFLEIKSRQPARPIIHHLARLYSKKCLNDKRVIPLLKEALAKPNESYVLEERVQNVLTTLANAKWEQNKEELFKLKKEDHGIQEIFDLLSQAREEGGFNAHSYFIQVKILRDLSKNKELDEKVDYINYAIDLVNEALSLCRGSPFFDCNKLESLHFDLLDEIDPRDAKIAAEELLVTKGDGSGYYTLARIEFDRRKNIEQSSFYLDKAMEGEICPPTAIALKIEILLKDKFPNYKDLLSLVKRLSSDGTFKDTWISAYNKAVVYSINSMEEEAIKYFKISNRKANRNYRDNFHQQFVQLFVMEGGHRKTYSGIIGTTFNKSEGFIHAHDFLGARSAGIYFIPSAQKYYDRLRSGLHVYFELGFSRRGPIAFDVRPFRSMENM